MNDDSVYTIKIILRPFISRKNDIFDLVGITCGSFVTMAYVLGTNVMCKTLVKKIINKKKFVTLYGRWRS